MIDAGEMRERLEVMVLSSEDSTMYRWKTVRSVWAKVVLTGKQCYFSKVGLGARAAEITMREANFHLNHALSWNGLHLFPTEITRPERGWMTVQAAVMDVATWTALGDGVPDVIFPAAITEKYVRYTQEEPMASHSVTYVLVTPKAIVLGPSDLVSNSGLSKKPYVVQACHTIDPWKNEYEIAQRKEA